MTETVGMRKKYIMYLIRCKDSGFETEDIVCAGH